MSDTKKTISVRGEKEMIAALARICAKRGGATMGGVCKEFVSEKLYEIDETYRAHIDSLVETLMDDSGES